MSVVSIPKKVMSMFDPIDPGFYSFRIGTFEEGLSKAKDSTNYVTQLEVIAGNGGKFNGHNIRVTFNSKPIGLAKLGKLVEAATAVDIKGGKEEQVEVDLEKLAGKEVDGKVTHRTDQGNIYNDVDDFAPLGSLINETTPF